MNEDIDTFWKAVADPTRRDILDKLRQGPQTTGQIAEQFAQSRYGVMKHLTVLENCGLISIERSGRERWNYLNGSALVEALTNWLGPFQTDWGIRLGQLKQGVETDMKSNLGLDIRHEVTINASSRAVFTALTKNMDQWWKPTYRQAGEQSEISLDPQIGGAMLETSSTGHSALWGRVEEIKVPERLYMSGRFAVNGAVAGRVHFDLHAQDTGTCQLVLTHKAIGDISEDAQQNFKSGWTDLLENGLVPFVSG